MIAYSTPKLHPLDEAFYRMYLNEGIYDKFTSGVQSGYKDQMQKEDIAYAKYAEKAKSLLGAAQSMGSWMEKKLGLSPYLAVSLVAAGISGGASAIPMAALMWFARKYYVTGLRTAVSYGVDKAADALGVPQDKKPEVQPESMSFRGWLMMEEEKEGWGEYLAGKVGYGVGAVGGAIAALVKNVYNTVASRMKELKDYIVQHPREVTKIALTMGLAAATGGVVGKISKDVVDAVGEKIKTLLPSTNDLAQTQQAIVPEAGSGDFEGGTASSGDFGGDTATAADQMKHGGETLLNKDLASAKAQMHGPGAGTTARSLSDDFDRWNAEEKAKLATMSPHERAMYQLEKARAASEKDIDVNRVLKALGGDPAIDKNVSDIAKQVGVDDALKYEKLKRWYEPKTPDESQGWTNPDPEVNRYLQQAKKGLEDQAALRQTSMKAAERFVNRQK